MSFEPPLLTAPEKPFDLGRCLALVKASGVTAVLLSFAMLLGSVLSESFAVHEWPKLAVIAILLFATGLIWRGARRERIIIEDIATHPFWAPFKHLALPHGLLACWSSPIFSPQREVLGTFAMYYRETRGPRPHEIAWVDAATHLAAIAICRHHAAKFDLLITDHAMPGMNGMQLASAVREVSAGHPVILVTGFAAGKGNRRASFGRVQASD